ncbi:MAG: hypothetical protein ACE5Q6_16985 [Dehalococcoidia bacterium]
MYDFADAVDRNVQWFAAVSRELIQADTSTQLQACICLAIGDELGTHTRDLAHARLRELLAVLGEKDLGELWKGKLEHALMVGLIQRAYLGELSPNFASLIRRVNEDLGQLPPEQLPLRYQTAFLFLHRYGYQPYPETPDFDWPDDLYGLLMAEESELGTLCARLGLSTDFGCREVEVPEGLPFVLHACALNAWKAYNVEIAGALTRTLANLGERDSLGLRSTREFILQNQHPDGSFGFLGKEIYESQMKGTNFAALKLQVPFALHCLWTLAETKEAPYSLRHQIGSTRLQDRQVDSPFAVISQ